MFLAPPALRRRRPRTLPAPPAPTDETETHELEMGNSLSQQQRDALGTVAKLVPADQLQQLSGLLTREAGAPPSSSKKLKNQCRWCIETFDRKSNMYRHE